MIKVYTGLKGFAYSFFFIAGLVLVISILFWGITNVIQLFLPLLIVLSYLLVIVFVFGFLPATLSREMRPTLRVFSAMMSKALAASTWMMSFIFVVKAFGFWGVFFAFSFRLLAPIALAGAMLKASWHVAGHLAVWISFIYGMKLYSQWLLSLDPRRQMNGDIIDVDAVEVKDLLE